MSSSISLLFFNFALLLKRVLCKKFPQFALNGTFFSSQPRNEQISKQRIVVVGGGFGGLYTALQLSKQFREEEAEVILIDPKDRFVFLPLLYELAVGTASSVEVAPTYASLLNNSKVFIYVNSSFLKDAMK